jgi:FkbM family methyltransferase
VLDGLWETHVTEWLQHTLRPGQVFVDVGANIGYFTLLGGQLVGPQGRVVAVEAHPGLAELLRRNVIMNGLYGYVTTWHRAAWSSTTTLQLHQRLNFSGASSVGAIGQKALDRLGDTEEMVDVQAVPVDDLLEGFPPVDVLKMDIEGAELQAFTGLSRTLEASQQMAVMFEWAPALMEGVGDKAEALLELLEGHGFRFRLLEDDLAAIERAKLLDLPYGNVVATR